MELAQSYFDGLFEGYRRGDRLVGQNNAESTAFYMRLKLAIACYRLTQARSRHQECHVAMKTDGQIGVELSWNPSGRIGGL
ncbi:MAG: hypothetical protein C4530_22675 [Desulfobacteraceae bacterium]|nr:MAG: hypothetical protein C4530_22675 [Desulfobacteraceae bacterium]